jgi:acyl carrier protein
MTQNEAKVVEVLAGIFQRKGLAAPLLNDESVLDGSLGLESLDFAEMVIVLEQITGKDPFASGVFPSIRTVADLAALYD